jgi:cyclic pyranopterin phosphate synthase
LRSGASAEELAAVITDGWQARRDRGAEVRKALEDRGPRETFVQLEYLRQDPHLEMHTRGG